MNRYFVPTIGLSLVLIGHAHAQSYQWNGPFTETTNWSAGLWSPATPPAGGAPGTTLTFTHFGAGGYAATNDLGNPFVLTTLNLTSSGGRIDIGSTINNTLEFVGMAGINQIGIGYARFYSSATLAAANMTIGGANFGNISLEGILSGPGGLTINRPQNQFYTGLVDIIGANTFGGGVVLQSGNLRVGNAMALGMGTLTVNGGTIGASAATTIANNVTLNEDFVYNGFDNLTLTGVISESGGTRNVVLSAMTASRLILQGTNTYTGSTDIVVNPRIFAIAPCAGRLTFSGPNGSALLSSGFNVAGAGVVGGGALTLDNSIAGGNNNNRIGDNAPVRISGASLVLIGANGGATLEDIGVLSGRGSVVVTLDAGTTGNTGTTLQADSLARLDRGTFLFRGNNDRFGSPLGANIANLIFETAPALVGGGGAAGTTHISIIPYASGALGVEGNGSHLVTYGANGVRPLLAAAGEYAQFIISGTSTANNVELISSGTRTAITSPTQINALLNNNQSPFTGSTSTLTVTSGTVINSATAPIPAEMTLAFGASEAVLFVNFPLTVNGVLTGTNGLTKGGRDSLVLNNPANNVTGTLTLNEGTVALTDPEVIASFSDIVVNGQTDITPPGLVFNSTTGTATVNKPMTVNGGFVGIQSNAVTAILKYSGQISGPGGVLVNGGSVELTNTSNNYTGQTRVYSGDLLVSSDAVLGNGDSVDFSFGGLRLTGNWTTSRNIDFSRGTFQVDTAGFNWTVNAPVSGEHGIINKVGAGVWTLSAPGSLGQMVPPAIFSMRTINVNAGELRVTNSTGSATGTATIHVHNNAVISGNGTFGGNTFVEETAFVAPGTGDTTIGTLSFGNSLSMGGTFTADVMGSMADRVIVSGRLSLHATSVLEFPGGNVYDPNMVYTLMEYSSLIGTFGSTPGLPASQFLIYTPTSLLLVPEPTSILAVAGLGLAAGYRIRRRWKQI
jgi:hypothetical protein